MSGEEYDLDTLLDNFMELADEVAARPKRPACESFKETVDKVCADLQKSQAEMVQKAKTGKYDQMHEYWSNTVGLRHESYPDYMKIESSYYHFSEEDKRAVQEDYDRYSSVKARYFQLCEAYENKMNDLWITDNRTSLIISPIFTVAAAFMIRGLGWNNFFTRLLALLFVMFFAKTLFERIIFNLQADRLRCWVISILTNGAAAFVWMFIIENPKVSFSIALGLILIAGSAWLEATEQHPFIFRDEE